MPFKRYSCEGEERRVPGVMDLPVYLLSEQWFPIYICNATGLEALGIF